MQERTNTRARPLRARITREGVPAMNNRNYFLASAFSVILVLACATRWHAQPEADKQDSQAISQTGLLPVYQIRERTLHP